MTFQPKSWAAQRAEESDLSKVLIHINVIPSYNVLRTDSYIISTFNGCWYKLWVALMYDIGRSTLDRMGMMNHYTCLRWLDTFYST